MKSRILKGILTFTLSIAMVFGNLGYAYAEEDVSGNNAVIDEQPETTETEQPETTEEATTVVEIPEDETPLAPTPAPTDGVSDNDPGESVSDNTVSENTVSENTVSENTVSENTINLPLSEDGKFYILSKNIEGRNITITLNIPVDLFPEATEISFDAVEAEKEVQKVFEDAVQEEVDGEGYVREVELFDISLFVNGEQITKFDDTIQVVFSGSEIPTDESEDKTVSVYYFDEEEEEIEDLSNQTTIENNEVKVEVEHFSTYGVVKIESATYSTKANVLNGLGVARNFAVFANEFTNSSHMEGNIAVNKLHVGNNIDMTNNEIAQSSDDFTVTLSKTVTSGSKGGTFHFAFYTVKNPGANDKPVATTSVFVSSGKTDKKENITLNDGTSFDGATTYYIYETDENGYIYNQGQECYVNGYKYDVTFSSEDVFSNTVESNEISNLGNISFIKQFDGGKKEVELFNAGDGVINTKVVFGEGYSFFKENYDTSKEKVKGIEDQSGNSVYLNSTNSSYYIADNGENGKASINGKLVEENYGSFPINFETEFTNLKQLSIDLSKTTGILNGNTENSELIVYNVPADEAHKTNEGRQKEIDKIITDNPNKLVILNVDCTGKTDFTWNSGYYLLDEEKRSWENDKKVSKYGNVIWNFYEDETITPATTSTKYVYEQYEWSKSGYKYEKQKEFDTFKGEIFYAGGLVGKDKHYKYKYKFKESKDDPIPAVTEKKSYSGRLSVNGEVGGTILAPDATVTTLIVEGTVIAKNLTINNEIHEVLLKKDKVEVNCTNKQHGTVPVAPPIKIDQSKSASLTDWDNRTYKIDLNVSTDNVQKAGNDIVLVLDCSNSMTPGDRMTQLRTAVKEFIGSLSTQDRVAIIEYNNDAVIKKENYWSTTYFYSALGDNGNINSTVSTFIDSLKNETGTRTDLALKQAIEVLAENTDGSRNRSVILFTDGSPTNASATNVSVKSIVEDAMDYASTIRNANISLYTIAYDLANGYSGNSSDPKWNTEYYNGIKFSGAKDWLSRAIASSGCDYEASGLEKLKEAFANIGSSISKKIVIKDVIDYRFDLVDEKGNVYTSKKDINTLNFSLYINGIKQDKTTVENIYGATLSVQSDGTLLLTWNETVEGVKKTDTHPNGWTKEIALKAKEDFIGGNAIATNGADSGVTVEGETPVPFDRPEVNVKVRFDADKAETEMFWGERLIGNKENVTKGVNPGTETFDYLSDTIYEELLYVDGYECVTWTPEGEDSTPIELYYYDNGVKGDLVTYSTEAFGTKWYDAENKEVTDMGSVSENGTYSCEFTFKKAGTSSDASKTSCTLIEGNENRLYEVTEDNSKAIGTYTVSIVAGTITVVKQIKGDYKQINGDPVFTFKIEDVSNDKIDGFTTKTYYKTLRFMDGENGELSATITGLPKGEYVVTELNTMGFTEVSHCVEASNCYEADDNTLYLGYRRTGKGSYSDSMKALHTYKADKGSVRYVNTCNPHDKLTHTDTVKNTYVVNKDGTTVWTTAEEDVDNGETQKLPYSQSDNNQPLKSAWLSAPDVMTGKKNDADMTLDEIQE